WRADSAKRSTARTRRTAPPLPACFGQHSLHGAKGFDDVGNRYRMAFARSAVLDLDVAGGDAARPDDDLPGNAYEVGGGEFCTGAAVCIVIEHFAAGGCELGIDLLRGMVTPSIAHFCVDNDG